MVLTSPADWILVVPSTNVSRRVAMTGDTGEWSSPPGTDEKGPLGRLSFKTVAK